MESNRQKQASNKVAKKSIDKLLQGIEKSVTDIEITRLIESDDDWHAQSDIMQSVPGIAGTTSATMLAELPELGQLHSGEIASLVGVAP